MPRELLEEVYYKARRTLLEPGDFFASLSEEGIDESLKYLAVISLLPAFAGAVRTSTGQGIGTLLFTFFGAYLLIIIGLLVLTVVLQLFALSLDSTETYHDSFMAVAYGYTPTALIGWVPFLSALGWLYTIYLILKGISVRHSMSMWRAGAVLLLPVIFTLIFVTLAVTVVYTTMSTIGLSTASGTGISSLLPHPIQ